jgi:hypothetical protein
MNLHTVLYGRCSISIGKAFAAYEDWALPVVCNRTKRLALVKCQLKERNT